MATLTDYLIALEHAIANAEREGKSLEAACLRGIYGNLHNSAHKAHARVWEEVEVDVKVETV